MLFSKANSQLILNVEHMFSFDLVGKRELVNHFIGTFLYFVVIYEKFLGIYSISLIFLFNILSYVNFINNKIINSCLKYRIIHSIKIILILTIVLQAHLSMKMQKIHPKILHKSSIIDR